MNIFQYEEYCQDYQCMLLGRLIVRICALLSEKHLSIEQLLEILFRDVESRSQRSLSTILTEFPFLPPTIGPGDGRMIFLSQAGARVVNQIAALIRANSVQLKDALNAKDMANLTGRAIGQLIFGETDRTVLEFAIPTDLPLFKRQLKAAIELSVAELKKPMTFLFGAWLFQQSSIPPFEMGPVRLLHREHWVEESMRKSLLTQAQGARMLKRWRGTQKRRVKHASKQYRWNAILDAIGPCPWVCEVTVQGHSSGRSQQKAIVAARIALATIELAWDPSQSRLAKFGLLLDEGTDDTQTTVAYRGNEIVSAGWQRMRASPRLTADQIAELNKTNGSRRSAVGKALQTFVDANPATARPKLDGRLCRALMWFGEARRESSDYLAIVKFAAVLDTLAKGTKAAGICAVVARRLSIRVDEPFLDDRTSARNLVTEIYDMGRSRIIHGSQSNLVDDLDGLRFRADLLTTYVMRACIDWLNEYVGPDDDDAFRLVR